ncbi:MAG: hypothetical protein KatS3mg129_3054 [Leptospiraceae bacterium]|nr:MAG: hypothetical protein KatS3mg129_3054 [Leptospiraceae bacterium]
MKIIKYNKLLLLIVVISLLPFCKEQKDISTTQEKNKMVITFVSGDVKIIRKDEQGNIQEIPAKMGMFVYEDDSIRTEKGKIDLQTKSGSAIRIKEMTYLSVKSLSNEAGGETNLEMENGNIIANIKKATSKEDFKVATPTAIAGVRGTTFTVEVDPFEKTSSIKVLDGKVAVKPRVIPLEKASKEEIEKDPALKPLKELEKKEVIIEENQSAKLDPSIEKKLAEINEKAEKSDNLESAIQTEDIQTLVEEVKEKPQVLKTEKIEPAPELLIEKETMIILNPEEMKQIEEGKDIDQIFAKKQEERKIKEEQILKKIEESASKKKLKSEKEIKQYYNKLEIITLRNGKKISGAVIAQTGNIMVIHTPKGIIRVNKNEVESQEFK